MSTKGSNDKFSSTFLYFLMLPFKIKKSEADEITEMSNFLEMIDYDFLPL